MVRIAAALTMLAAAAGYVQAASSGETTNGEGAAAVCPAIQTATNALLYQSDNVALNADKIVAAIDGFLDQGEQTPTSELVQTLESSLTSGVVSNLAYGVVSTLASAGATLSNLQPQCKNDVSLCTERLKQAAGADSANLNVLQASCNQALFYCTRNYEVFSREDVLAVAPKCAQFNGPATTNKQRRAIPL
ncbi:hypothetical protein Rhopal_007390-T1 [Rhodotorula paludigena]|uniref:Secreted protein n=1 Tax=Rhodotorula paludigena TaxID=86838 RepID=A0AAV5GXU0_9BASI|nr:hypothetical protein Rhopal_007390-T1 [Rhodotorula paludigena]